MRAVALWPERVAGGGSRVLKTAPAPVVVVDSLTGAIY